MGNGGGSRGDRVFALASESVSPLGMGNAALLDSLLAINRAGAPITRFDASELPVNAAAEVRADLTDRVAPGESWPSSGRR